MLHAEILKYRHVEEILKYRHVAEILKSHKRLKGLDSIFIVLLLQSYIYLLKLFFCNDYECKNFFVDIKNVQNCQYKSKIESQATTTVF